MIKGMDNVIDVIERNNTPYLKMKSGESKVIRFINAPEDVVAVYQHSTNYGFWKDITCINEGCPLCEAGMRPALKVYFVVLDISDDKVKILKASKTMAKQIAGLYEEYGDLRKREFKITRSGEKFDTTYQFFPRDIKEIDLSKYEMPDIDSLVAPMDADEIRKLMNNAEYIEESTEDDPEVRF